MIPTGTGTFLNKLHASERSARPRTLLIPRRERERRFDRLVCCLTLVCFQFTPLLLPLDGEDYYLSAKIVKGLSRSIELQIPTRTSFEETGLISLKQWEKESPTVRCSYKY